jgi:thymidylate kinase
VTPRLVAVTGPDGTGKSTLVASVVARLGMQGGGGTPGGRSPDQKGDWPSAATVQVWDALVGLLPQADAVRYLGRIGDRSRALLLLHAASRALDLAHERRVELIVLDGYWYKYAVSEIEQGAPPELFAACETAFPRPDVVFALDLPVDEALRRKRATSAYERGLGRHGDSEDDAFVAFQTRLRDRWAALEARVGPWVHLSSTDPPEVLVDAVLARIATP